MLLISFHFGFQGCSAGVLPNNTTFTTYLQRHVTIAGYIRQYFVNVDLVSDTFDLLIIVSKLLIIWSVC